MHVWSAYVERTGGIGKIMLGHGVFETPTWSELEINSSRDYAVVRSDKLRGRGFIRVSDKHDLDENEIYYLLGYPKETRFRFQWPELTAGVSSGQSFDRSGQWNIGIRAWSGFSGGPVVDSRGEAVGIALNTSLSFTDSDYIGIMPVWEMEWVKNSIRKSGD